MEGGRLLVEEGVGEREEEERRGEERRREGSERKLKG